MDKIINIGSEHEEERDLVSFEVDDNLSIELITTKSHDSSNFPTIKMALEESMRTNNNIVYDLALIEGSERKSDDSRLFIEEKVAKSIHDPFLDPLSFKGYDKFKWSEAFKSMSTAEAAARYVSLWLLYAKEFNHSPESIDRELKKVFIPFKGTIPDYLAMVTLIIERTRKNIGETNYYFQCVSDFQHLMRVVNDESAKNICKVLKNKRGSVLVYCGNAHRGAVEDAVEILRKAR